MQLVLNFTARFGCVEDQTLRSEILCTYAEIFSILFFCNAICILLMKRKFVVTHTIPQTEIPALLDS